MIRQYKKRNTNPLLLDILIEWCKLVGNVLLVSIVLLAIALLAMRAYSETVSLHKHTSTCNH